jgi:hypothetical protein
MGLATPTRPSCAVLGLAMDNYGACLELVHSSAACPRVQDINLFSNVFLNIQKIADKILIHHTQMLLHYG